MNALYMLGENSRHPGLLLRRAFVWYSVEPTGTPSMSFLILTDIRMRPETIVVVELSGSSQWLQVFCREEAKHDGVPGD